MLVYYTYLRPCYCMLCYVMLCYSMQCEGSKTLDVCDVCTPLTCQNMAALRVLPYILYQIIRICFPSARPEVQILRALAAKTIENECQSLLPQHFHLLMANGTICRFVNPENPSLGNTSEQILSEVIALCISRCDIMYGVTTTHPNEKMGIKYQYTPPR